MSILSEAEMQNESHEFINTGLIVELPVEMYERILKFIDPYEEYNVACVCKAFYNILKTKRQRKLRYKKGVIWRSALNLFKWDRSQIIRHNILGETTYAHASWIREAVIEQVKKRNDMDAQIYINKYDNFDPRLYYEAAKKKDAARIKQLITDGMPIKITCIYIIKEVIKFTITTRDKEFIEFVLTSRLFSYIYAMDSSWFVKKLFSVVVSMMDIYLFDFIKELIPGDYSGINCEIDISLDVIKFMHAQLHISISNLYDIIIRMYRLYLGIPFSVVIECIKYLVTETDNYIKWLHSRGELFVFMASTNWKTIMMRRPIYEYLEGHIPGSAELVPKKYICR